MRNESTDSPVRVIVPQTGLDPFRGAISRLISDFTPATHLAARLFVRDTQAEHRQSLLGYVWLVVPVIANTVTWVFLNTAKVVRIDSGTVPYALFVLSGVVLWTAFNGAIMSMLAVVPKARGVLSKVNFPHESLVYSGILKSFLDALLALLIIPPVVAFFGNGMRPTMALYPLALVACLILGWGLGLLMVPIAALYGDVSKALQLALRFGFFLTPVIFPMPAAGIARDFMQVNPVTPLVTTGRAWLTGSNELMLPAFAMVSVGAFGVMAIGLIVFKVAMPFVIERVAG